MFVARRRGWFVWGHQTITISFGSIRWLSINLGPEGGGSLSVTLDIKAATPLPTGVARPEALRQARFGNVHSRARSMPFEDSVLATQPQGGENRRAALFADALCWSVLLL